MEKSSRRVSFLLALAFLLATVGALWQRQAIYDWIRLRDYTPSPGIVALADTTSMTDYGRHVFYVYHPTLEDKDSFNAHCTNSERSIVLGCYVEHQGIYIFDVTDERLSGIEEVTAAHEMLHAAYDRLSSKEKKRIDALVASAFADVKDQRVLDTVERYRERDATIVPNELHSILGTEVRNLPAELEQYYAKYFKDRSAVVVFSEKYQQAFTERQTKIDEYDQRLKTLQSQIDALQSSLKSQEEGLQAERARLDSLRSTNRVDEYNASVPGFNERIRRYNVDVASARQLIDEYNKVVASRNAIAVEENELIKAIDSRPGTMQAE